MKFMKGKIIPFWLKSAKDEVVRCACIEGCLVCNQFRFKIVQSLD